jgi:hypothetical protein
MTTPLLTPRLLVKVISDNELIPNCFAVLLLPKNEKKWYALSVDAEQMFFSEVDFVEVSRSQIFFL